MNFTLTVLGLDPVVEALHALAKALRPSEAVMSGTVVSEATVSGAVIAPIDRPDVGVDPKSNAIDNWAQGFVPPAAAAAVAPAPTPLPPLPPIPEVAAAPASPPAAPVPPAPVVPTLPTAATVPTAAPVSAPTPPAPAAADPAVDADGYPWDARIHSAPAKKGDPKPMNADGTWRKRRGTADTYVAEIKRELRAAMAANAAAGAPLPAPVPAPAPVAPIATTAPTTVVPAPVALVPSTAAPVPPALAAPTTAVPAGILFGQLATKLEPFFVSQRLTMAAVAPVLTKYGLSQFNQLMHTPALVPLVDGELSALLGVPPGVPQ